MSQQRPRQSRSSGIARSVPVRRNLTGEPDRLVVPTDDAQDAVAEPTVENDARPRLASGRNRLRPVCRSISSTPELTAPFGRSADKAATALADLITRGAPTGTYYKRTKPVAPPKASRDTGSQRWLWTTAASLLGIDVADTIGGARSLAEDEIERACSDDGDAHDPAGAGTFEQASDLEPCHSQFAGDLHL